MESYKIQQHNYDVIVVGAGGAGLRATFGWPRPASRPPASPRCSRRAAYGGGAGRHLGGARQHGRRRLALALVRHVKGSDWLGDQDAIEYMCREAIPAIIELEHYGVPFSRTEEGKIYQRPFGGMTTHYGKGTAQRTCAAADRTGHAILHTLYQQALAHDATFFIEYFALDLILDERRLPRRARARHERRHAAFLPRAGGGDGDRRLRPRLLQRTSAHTCTGDGGGMVLRAGLPLQDMEFVQFHPTGIYGAGCLITEGVARRRWLPHQLRRRALHGALCAERQGLASRDVVSRAMTIEIREGRGVGKHKDHIHLHLMHLGPK
jgi:succinate dehydrogenase / fumarate reductase flavoprotein subunit